jgi:hypothetical protein
MGGLWKRIPQQLRDKAYLLAWQGYSINYCGKGELGVHIVAKKRGFPNSVRIFSVICCRVVEHSFK